MCCGHPTSGGGSKVGASKSRGSVPEYGMRSFPGARQQPGAKKEDLEYLRTGRKDHSNVEQSTAPTVAEETDSSEQESHRPKPVNPNAKGSATRTKKPKRTAGRKKAKTRRTTKTRTKRSTASSYQLPPRESSRGARSHHFRLPETIAANLIELAEAYDCTRTHVVCSAIRAEWQKLTRRKAREAKQAAAAGASADAKTSS